ncbi:LysR family transcriptional regulator [Kaustia mangrovi]|uniref:LysR family transcriptional regulator n=1 Tax=Kaustia mangrovi TaxID=2593653 RepID=A0A7S8C5G7_9HYPH|nr:LysR family transcriptional regulator [Kaustia mangrovi]QPC43760.1 LysR family transcriptional regulator [Kaustia mangrovi]
MDKVRQMQVFIHVMESGNFSRAAEAMNMPRSTVSTVIQALEDRLGTQLIHRTTRRVTPTHDGLRFLETARELVEAVEASERMFRPRPAQATGRLRVDMPSRIGRRIVIPALPGFLAAHPRLDLELSTTDRMVDMVGEGVDCVVRVGELADSALVCRKLGDIALINCASPDYLARYGTPEGLDDLPRHHMVNYAVRAPFPGAEWEYADGRAVRAVPMGSLVTVDNAEAYIAAARAGLGLIQIPEFDVRDLLAEGALVDVLARYRPPAMPLSFLYARRRNLPARIRVFQSWIGDLLVARGVLPASGGARGGP